MNVSRWFLPTATRTRADHITHLPRPRESVLSVKVPPVDDAGTLAQARTHSGAGRGTTATVGRSGSVNRVRVYATPYNIALLYSFSIRLLRASSSAAAAPSSVQYRPDDCTRAAPPGTDASDYFCFPRRTRRENRRAPSELFAGRIANPSKPPAGPTSPC